MKTSSHPATLNDRESEQVTRTGPGNEPDINGAIMTRETQKTTVNTIGVSSVDEFAKKIVGAEAKSSR